MTEIEQAIEWITSKVPNCKKCAHEGVYLGCGDQDKVNCAFVRAVYETCLTALRAQAERQNPRPLTLEQLREMDGEPVWYHHLADVEWMWEGWHIHRNDLVKLDDYGKTWLPYAHKPAVEVGL